jgi:signal transduction histidine kinase
VVASETRRLASLVEDRLDLARADAHELTVAVRPVELGPVVRGVVAAIAPWPGASARSPSRTRSRCPRSAPRPTRTGLAQVLTNLVRNAVNHTPEGGAVMVAAGELAADRVWVDVSDTGGGIAAEDLERIFERFYRGDRSRARDSGGFGLGISIARELAAAMGGDIGVTSEPGVGSTFRVTLPRA